MSSFTYIIEVNDNDMEIRMKVDGHSLEVCFGNYGYVFRNISQERNSFETEETFHFENFAKEGSLSLELSEGFLSAVVHVEAGIRKMFTATTIPISESHLDGISSMLADISTYI